MKFGLIVAALLVSLDPTESTFVNSFNAVAPQVGTGKVISTNAVGGAPISLATPALSLTPSYSTNNLAGDFNSLRSSLTALSDKQRQSFQSLDQSQVNSAVVIGTGNIAAGIGNLISGNQNAAYGLDLSIVGSGNAIKGSNSTILGN